MIRKQKFATKTVFSILFAGALLTSMQSQGQVNVLPPIAAAGAEGLTTSLIVKNEAFRLYGEKKSALRREASEIKNAVRTFTDRFGVFGTLDIIVVENPMSLFLIDHSQYQPHFLPLLSYAALASANSDEDVFGNKDKNILSHEVCHKFMILLMEQKGLQNKTYAKPRYGHTELPDWFDEIAAISCESEAMRKKRLSDFYAKGNADSLLPIAEFLSVEHPSLKVMEKQLSQLVAKAKANVNASGFAMEVMEINEEKSEESLTDYYVQALLFDRFIEASLGEGAVKELVELLAQQRSVEAWLVNKLALDSIEDVDSAFKKFVSETYAIHKSSV